MNEKIPASVAENAVLAAWQAAWREYEVGPCYHREDAFYTFRTATGTAFHELSRTFSEPVAEDLALAMARAARSHFLAGLEYT
jgi:hypothetical protein